jgi:4-alpha-glucanotransferase
MWTGSDLRAQQRLDMNPNIDGTEKCRRQMVDIAGIAPDDPLDAVTMKMHESIATAPSRLLAAQIDDALGVEERPNMPATTAEQWPNWSIALPRTLDEIRNDAIVRRVAASLSRQR